MSTQVNDEYQSDSGMEVLQVARLPTGDYEVTHVPTGDTIVVDQGSASQQGIAPRPASEHHLIDGCGVDWGRPYCDLTRAAQGAIIAGTTGGVVAAICYFGGPGICIVAGAAVAAVGWYLIEYGRCPGNLRVRLNYSGNFSVWCL